MIQTSRLLIRPIEAEDAESAMWIWDDFALSPYAKYDVPHLDDLEMVKRKLGAWSEVFLMGDHLFFAVCREGEVIGLLDFHRFADDYEFGYCFHSSAQGKGYARESLEAVMEWLAGDKQTRFVVLTGTNNLPSVRLLEALGFERAGAEPVSFYKDEAGKDIVFESGIYQMYLPRTKQEAPAEGSAGAAGS